MKRNPERPTCHIQADDWALAINNLISEHTTRLCVHNPKDVLAGPQSLDYFGHPREALLLALGILEAKKK